MAFLIFIFCSFSSWSLSAFNFTPSNDPSFNKVFYEKQILWGIENYIPELGDNKEFKEHLMKFIYKESSFLFITTTSSNIFIPKYFFRFKSKGNSYDDFELALIMSDGSSSLWNKNGQLKQISFYTNTQQLPKECPLKSNKKFLYAEYNINSSFCSSFFLEPNSSSPLSFFNVTVENSDKTNYSLFSPKVFYPGVIKGGNSSVYKHLRTDWRLVFSRVQNLESHSVIYFP